MTEDPLERAAARRWTAIIVGLLAISVGANVWLLGRAVGDPAFSVEPDYYQRAVHWDDERARAEKSDALGWTLRTSFASPAVGGGERRLEVALLDRDGQPVRGAEVRVIALHVARADVRSTGVLEELAPGRYAAELPLARGGLWELAFEAKQDDRLFLDRQRVELPGLDEGAR